MRTISETLKRKSFFYCEEGASAEQITKAENALGLEFADEYKEYLHLFGSVSCGGHELTGISKDERLDVIEVTRRNRVTHPDIPHDLYVIEETHIDGIVIWQVNSGEIFYTEENDIPIKVYKSFSEYASTFEDAEEE